MASIATAAGGKATNRAWIMTLLVTVYASNFLDRTIVNVLQQPIKEELGLQDWQLGLLGGTTFALFYTVFGLSVARLAERGDRTRILSVCIILWSIFTALCGAVTAFWQLLLLRIGVAVGEAGATPIGHSLISDTYPPDRRAGAMAVFTSGNTIGLVGGAVLGAVVGQAYGWRWAFVAAGAPGLLLALLTWFTIREPRKLAPPDQQPISSGREVARKLFATPTFRHLTAGYALTLFAGYGIPAFAVPHLMRSFDLPLRTAGILGGAGGGVMLGIGTIVGGFAAQALSRRDRRWMVWTPGIAIGLAAPFGVAAFRSQDVAVAVILFFAMNLGIGTFQGPMYSTVHSLVGPRERATASAILLMAGTLFGLGLGPLAVGYASDLAAASAFGAPGYASLCAAGTAADDACRAASAQGLRLALAACSLVFAWAALHFFLAGRSIRRDVLD